MTARVHVNRSDEPEVVLMFQWSGLRACTKSTDTDCMRAGTLIKAPLPELMDTHSVVAVPRTTPAGFGPYLEQVMVENGFATFADLSRASKVDATTIGRWVRGEKEPTIPLLRQVAPHLGVRLGDLMIRAGLATAAELGTIGAPPPPRAPLPPELQRVVSILLSPRVPDAAKRTLLGAVARTVELWQEMVDAPREPQMRRRTPDAKR